ncbi:kinesin-like protein KIN-10C [Rhododendron vialii]|uniref:kinesin-like protein KIN-10C n=1 Tax=Rhododendron vialii TaxID=182163 RepID=UPI00265D7E8E|nr:kinesin-like protein KIN-10C [Rhododendron vialii]
MASSAADPDRVKPSSCSNPSRKVRIVAKIRGFTDQETESLNGDSAPWISVRKPNEDGSAEKTTVSFGDQSARNGYEVDYCYEQNEDNSMIFSREIQPLISRVFYGQNVGIIAFGATGSGKTYTIQGTEEKHGLGALAFAEVLTMAEDNQKSVAISLYEVFQDHVYDLLDPTRSEVQVFEDAQGKIKLKGLSQAFVKSIPEFHKLYFAGCNSRRATKQVPFEKQRRSHKGLIIHIICTQGCSSTKLLGKINLVDLAGYEDARRKSVESLNLFDSSRVNKSLYALLNVVNALNANENRVPYRESRLTRMLQDSFGGRNHALMLICLNPLSCQDTIYATSLASRSLQGVNRVFTNTTMKTKTSAKPMVTKGRLGIASATSKKPTSSRAQFSEKTSRCLVKGRKLFDKGNQFMTSEQAKAPANVASAMQSRFLPDVGSATEPSLLESVQEQEDSVSDSFPATLPTDEESSLRNALGDAKPTEEKDVHLCSENKHSEVAANVDRNMKALTYLEEGDNMDKENKILLINKDESPPLSARLRDLTNNLKSLYSATPIQMKIPNETDTSSRGLVVSTDIVEPKTPVTQHAITAKDKREVATDTSSRDLVVYTDIVEPKTPVTQNALTAKDKWEVANCQSGTFNARSSGFKHSLVHDYLRFLNSASKEELKGIRGIGEKRASYILELREESPEPFKNLDDLKDIGLSAKQIKGMMKNVAGELFS